MTHIKSRKHALGRENTGRSGHLAVSIMTALALGAPIGAMAGTHGSNAAGEAVANTADAGTGGVSESGSERKVDQAQKLPEIKVEAARPEDFRAESASFKFTQPLLDTPQTLQVITSDLFIQQGATTLTEVLRNSAGVGAFYAGENGSTSTGDAIRMRGFDASGSIFVDGVRDLGSISRDIFNIRQVEVTKGPDGTEFGRTAPSGAVNLVTKQPLLGHGVSGSVAAGSGEHRRATLDWNQQIGQTQAFRMNLMWQDSGVAGRDAIQHDRWGVAPSLAFGLGTPTRLYLDFLHVQQNNVPDGGVSTIGLPGYASPDAARPQIGQAPRVDSSNFYGTDADHDDVQADMFTMRLEHDYGSGWHLRNTLRWGRMHQDYLLTSFMASTDRLHTPDLEDYSTWTIPRSIPTFKHYANRIITNQAALVGQLDSGAVSHDLSTGIELAREKHTATDFAALDDTAWPDANLYHPDPHVSGLVWGPTGGWSDGKTDTAAVYAFDTMHLGSRWQLNGGVRLDHYKTDFTSMLQCGTGRRAPDCGGLPVGSVVPGVDADVSGNLFTWKLGALYKPTDNGSVYINYAASSQPPGGAALELSDRANNADNPAFDPQRARTLELGAKWSLSDERLLLTAALYRTEVDNQIEQDPVDSQYYQTGRKRVQGVELGAVGKITDAWSVSAGYTLIDSEITRGAAEANDGSSDLAYTPRNAFTSWTTWRLPMGLTLGGGVRYSGGMKRGHDGAVGTPEYTESYWVVDAMARYPIHDNLDVRLNLYNLTDKDYVASINKSGYRYTPGVPRSAMVTLDFRF